MERSRPPLFFYWLRGGGLRRLGQREEFPGGIASQEVECRDSHSTRTGRRRCRIGLQRHHLAKSLPSRGRGGPEFARRVLRLAHIQQTRAAEQIDRQQPERIVNR